MSARHDSYAGSPEALIVGLAKAGDSAAFEDLVRRRQSWIRNLMRRLSGDAVLADDLAQQVFLLAWSRLGQLQKTGSFGAWLKRIAVSVWLQHLRKKDALSDAESSFDTGQAQEPPTGMAMDLDRALSTLPGAVRTCIVLSYHERMTHQEICETTGLPLGTVKSHIRRGTQHLQTFLAAYRSTHESKENP